MSKIDQIRAQSQMKQYQSNNITLDFDTIQASRQGVHSTLGHHPQQFQTVVQNEAMEIDGSSFNNTAIMTSAQQSKGNPTNNSAALSHFKEAASKSSSKFNGGGGIQIQSQHHYILSLQAASLDLEQKMTAREREIDLLSSQNDRVEARRDLYCNTLDQMAAKDKGFSGLLLKLKQGLQSIMIAESRTKLSQPDFHATIVQIPQGKPAESTAELQKKLVGYERIMKEMKKQIAAQKTEIQQIKQMEQFLSLDNYQKLINEFNTLYEHYKGLKQINKKIKVELKQSNQRERTFLKLLKRTHEYGEQAIKLEAEYDRVVKEDQRLGLSVENLIIDSNDRREPELIDRCGVQIPKLDLSSIFIQREALPSNPKGGEQNSDDEDDDDDESNDGESEQLDSKAKKEKFEQ